MKWLFLLKQKLLELISSVKLAKMQGQAEQKKSLAKKSKIGFTCPHCQGKIAVECRILSHSEKWTLTLICPVCAIDLRVKIAGMKVTQILAIPEFMRRYVPSVN